MSPSPTSGWQLLGQPHALQGCWHGSAYPAMLLALQVPALNAAQLADLDHALATLLPELSLPLPAAPVAVPLAASWWLVRVQALQRAAGLPIVESPRLLGHRPARVQCLVPYLPSHGLALARLLHAFVTWLGSAPDADPAAAQALQHSLAALARLAPKASNVSQFLRAACELDLPFLELPGQMLQYGQGSRARRLDSTYTDRTPAMAAKLARHKAWAAALLRQVGLPVPDHALVGSAEQAVQVAGQLGYPVVVKPADCDGGTGVSANLLEAAEVRDAYQRALQYSRSVLVEKHVPGRDYRLTVVEGRLVWAVERVPGGVVGNGRDTILELLATLNADPNRGIGARAPLKHLAFDDEARRLLQRQQLTPTHRPAAGEFVRLRLAANVATGGTPVAVFDQVHPDNARLAERAADAFGLDIAGIDLLIPDIAVSWRQSGAYLCEVNGQPSLGQTTARHLYGPLLQQLVPDHGRIPIVLVVGAAQPDLWLEALANGLQRRSRRVGLVSPQAVRRDDELLRAPPFTVAEGLRQLLLDRQVDAVVAAINDDSLLSSGLPMSRYTALVLAGSHLTWRAGHDPAHLRTTLLEQVLLPACDGRVFSLAGQQHGWRPQALRTGVRQTSLADGAYDKVLDALG